MAGAVIGRLDRQVTIQTPTVAQDSTGSTVTTWANLTTDATPWARLERTRGGEDFKTGHVEQAERTLTFVIRHRTDLNEEMRIVYEGQNWDIELIETIGRGDMLRIVCTANVR